MFDIRLQIGQQEAARAREMVDIKVAVSPESSQESIANVGYDLNGVVHEGYLSRKAIDNDFWHPEYFILFNDHTCQIYTGKQAVGVHPPREIVRLSDAYVLPYVSRYGIGQGLLFDVRTEAADFLLQAANDGEKSTWVSKFSACCGGQKSPDLKKSPSASRAVSFGPEDVRRRRFSNSWSMGSNAEEAKESRLRGSSINRGVIPPESSPANGLKDDVSTVPTGESPIPPGSPTSDTFKYESSDEADDEEDVLWRRI